MIVPWIVIFLAAAADQISKAVLARILPGLEGGTLPLIPDVLHFTYVENRGAAFGMLSEHRWVFMILSVIGIAAILLLLLRESPKSLWVQTAAGLVAGGGIANMIDRVRLGYVVDFIDCRFIDFYVFNIADSCVTVGCAIYFVAVLVEEIRAYRKKKADGTPEETADTPGAPEAEGSAPEAEEKERRGDA